MKILKKMKKTFFQIFFRRILFLLFLWVLALAVWLYKGYQLEFLGKNTFLELWFASIFFHVVNVLIIVAVVIYFKEGPEKIKKKGK